MSPDRRKRHEREIAGLRVGRRLPNNGAAQPDDLANTSAGTLAVQAKTRKAVPAWLLGVDGLDHVGCRVHRAGIAPGGGDRPSDAIGRDPAFCGA